jgi:hypothetical protein
VCEGWRHSPALGPQGGYHVFNLRAAHHLARVLCPSSLVGAVEPAREPALARWGARTKVVQTAARTKPPYAGMAIARERSATPFNEFTTGLHSMSAGSVAYRRSQGAEDVVADQLTHLCIISRDPVRSGDFIEALRASLPPEDNLEIITDRRRGGASREFDLKQDHRRQPQVDLALAANGFAIVPASVNSTAEETSRSLLVHDDPMEPPYPQDDDNEAPENQRSGTLIPRLLGALSGAALAALVIALAGQGGQTRVGRLLNGSLVGGGERGQINESLTPAHSPTVAEKPVAVDSRAVDSEISPRARPNNDATSAGGPPSTKSASLRDADRLIPKRRETSGSSEVTGPASREPRTASGENTISAKKVGTSPRDAHTSTNETGASPKAGTGESVSAGRPGFRTTPPPTARVPAPSKQVATDPSSDTATPRSTRPLGGAHRAELVRMPVSRGWGDSYAVRLLDPGGRPMVVTEVLLVARMADGSVESIAMGALPEPGTYRATVPTSHSTPVDLHVQVNTGDKIVEVPVRP